MSKNTTAVHVTHEAIGKIGGIGAVLEGLFTSSTYNREIERSILVCPLFTTEGNASTRLGPDSEVLYSSLDGINQTNYYPSFHRIEEQFNVNIIYGRRTFHDERHDVKSSPEIVLIDVSGIDQDPVNRLKSAFFQEFGICSDRYEHIWDYEQWLRLGPPAIEVIKAIGAANPAGETIVFAHEYMGMPTALTAKLDLSHDFKTVFYAHEVATMRPIVETHSGHDTMFYNTIEHAHKEGLYVNEVFGDQTHYFKHVLVEASRFCDNILAVGDYVQKELRFMAPEFEQADIKLTYNGIPAFEIELEEKNRSKDKLREYCSNLLDYKPDYIFTHVTRMTPSKGLWRDFKVLGNLDKRFQKEGKTGVLLVLSTETHKRRKRDIYHMEADYNWPVAHREGMPDLTGGEANYYTGLQEFNARSRNIKAIFINQFGFDMESCGRRMPYDMEFMDIRKGSDAEFGQSIYEPFGIAQLEPLSFGGICVITNVCGCAGFVRDITGGAEQNNVIVADYTDLGTKTWRQDLEDFLIIDKEAREDIEKAVSYKVAQKLYERLPKNDAEMQSLMSSGYNIAKHMNWDSVMENYVLKSIHNAVSKKHMAFK